MHPMLPSVSTTVSTPTMTNPSFSEMVANGLIFTVAEQKANADTPKDATSSPLNSASNHTTTKWTPLQLTTANITHHNFPARLRNSFPAGLPISFSAGVPTVHGNNFPAELPNSFSAGVPTVHNENITGNLSELSLMSQCNSPFVPYGDATGYFSRFCELPIPSHNNDTPNLATNNNSNPYAKFANNSTTDKNDNKNKTTDKDSNELTLMAEGEITVYATTNTDPNENADGVIKNSKGLTLDLNTETNDDINEQVIITPNLNSLTGGGGSSLSPQLNGSTNTPH